MIFFFFLFLVSIFGFLSFYTSLLLFDPQKKKNVMIVLEKKIILTSLEATSFVLKKKSSISWRRLTEKGVLLTYLIHKLFLW